MKNEYGTALQRLQQTILEGVALGEPLRSLMTYICETAEAIAPDTICSVLAIDAEGRVQHLASPSLPETYSRRIDGTPIGPCVGSCGTAAYRGEAVEVTDIATDPLWSDYKQLALPLGLKACWSSPIKARDGRVIGTFAFYFRTQRGPSSVEREIVQTCVHICSIAIEHEETQARIQHIAFHDELTGLPNRSSFLRCAEHALERSRTEGIGVAIHSIDLDDFKGVNDTLGHGLGDMLLGHVAKRLCSALREGEFVARLGGDEFAVLQTSSRSREDAAERASAFLCLFDQPFEVENHSIRIGASIGIAQAPRDGYDVLDLMKRADLALYRAKHSGGSAYRFFTPAMYTRLRARRTMEQDLRRALATGEFELFYQPIVTLSSKEMIGLEALVRWNHPTRGLISPGKFIPLAEEVGLIGPLGEWILIEACRQARSFSTSHKVAVNLSPRQLTNPTFVLDVVRALHQADLPPQRLELEITESVPLVENTKLRKCLHELRELGVGISLDDFGTGYSSLSYLRTFPFDSIKIDRSFIQDLGQRSDSTSIVRTVIGLARELGIRTTAEGIETPTQLAWLSKEGCTHGQGYLFGQPRRPADLPCFLASSSEDRCARISA
jgi:diguanylate cyclase (GGDEF)-like protein